MTQPRYDLLGLGNAIIDIIAQVPDDFLTRHRMAKGAMTLIEEAPAEMLLGAMGATVTVAGGSAANTIIGAAGFGCSTSFIGRVKNDKLGDLFADGVRAAGVDFPTKHAQNGPTTGRCFILVTPDGQRTMNTYLGACQDLSEEDVDQTTVAAAKVVYLEGYLWDPPGAKAAFLKAARIAHASGNKVALSLSDAFCVGRYRDEFLGLIRDGTVDVLFANDAEVGSLYETGFDEALARLREERVLAAVTRGEKGCIVVAAGHALEVPAMPVAQVVDTTGAGDLFAAGFVAGLVRDLDHGACARLGALAAAEIIQHLGARPKVDLRSMAAAGGLAL